VLWLAFALRHNGQNEIQNSTRVDKQLLSLFVRILQINLCAWCSKIAKERLFKRVFRHKFEKARCRSSWGRFWKGSPLPSKHLSPNMICPLPPEAFLVLRMLMNQAALCCLPKTKGFVLSLGCVGSNALPQSQSHETPSHVCGIPKGFSPWDLGENPMGLHKSRAWFEKWPVQLTISCDTPGYHKVKPPVQMPWSVDLVQQCLAC
jgi:hypothetical protein